MSRLSLRIESAEGPYQRVFLSGRLDGSTHAELDTALAPLLHDGTHILEFNLAGLDYISSAGLRSIFRARKALDAHAGRVLVMQPQAPVRKVFELVKAVPVEEVFASQEELDNYLSAIQAKVASGEL